MTLPPMAQESTQWLGFYFTCRQIQSEIEDHKKPQKDILSYIEGIRNRWSYYEPVLITPGEPSFGLLLHLTISSPATFLHKLVSFAGGQSSLSDISASLYKLYLNNLTFVQQEGEADTSTARRTSTFFGPYCDLKSLDNRIFYNFMVEGRVNCKSVTFTIERLVNEEGGRDRSTPLDNIAEGNIPFTLTIVQNKRDQQVERTYSSPTRFRPSLP
ncbi:hypothetical protein K469DRAFT_719062 [Zopfia rhizophila CBS 207.26]|uniref:Uncharacterized protein n=1 Tax=Zopfia rhizophila CBS 207.26 TaxID=1314779 RepID=A0A6A6EQ08_9PEZI|nr:hypothetical protein K469DRAFT_719062 [Zopfia rhizophila CBS 207.26]